MSQELNNGTISLIEDLFLDMGNVLSANCVSFIELPLKPLLNLK